MSNQLSRRLRGRSSLWVGAALLLLSLIALIAFKARLASVIHGPRQATAAEILASFNKGDDQEWFELTEQPSPVLTHRFLVTVKGKTRPVSVYLMSASSAPGLAISTEAAFRSAPIDVWICNKAAGSDDYGRGVQAALDKAGLAGLAPIMLCEATNSRVTVRLVAVYLCLWFSIVGLVIALPLVSRFTR